MKMITSLRLLHVTHIAALSIYPHMVPSSLATLPSFSLSSSASYLLRSSLIFHSIAPLYLLLLATFVSFYRRPWIILRELNLSQSQFRCIHVIAIATYLCIYSAAFAAGRSSSLMEITWLLPYWNHAIMAHWNAEAGRGRWIFYSGLSDLLRMGLPSFFASKYVLLPAGSEGDNDNDEVAVESGGRQFWCEHCRS